jgi:T-complex protein 1 subunit eta
LKLLDIVHPAARTLVDIARAQDAEVGDGTTSVTILYALLSARLDQLTNRAAEILKEVKPFVEEGVGSHVIIKGLKAARDLVSVLLEPGT